MAVGTVAASGSLKNSETSAAVVEPAASSKGPAVVGRLCPYDTAAATAGQSTAGHQEGHRRAQGSAAAVVAAAGTSKVRGPEMHPGCMGCMGCMGCTGCTGCTGGHEDPLGTRRHYLAFWERAQSCVPSPWSRPFGVSSRPRRPARSS